jgi:hypothetical protein
MAKCPFGQMSGELLRQVVERDEQDTAKYLSEDDVKGAKVFHSLTHSLSLSLSHTLLLTHTRTLSLAMSLSQTHPHSEIPSKDDVKGAKVLPPSTAGEGWPCTFQKFVLIPVQLLRGVYSTPIRSFLPPILTVGPITYSHQVPLRNRRQGCQGLATHFHLFRALSGRLTFTVPRHEFKIGSLSSCHPSTQRNTQKFLDKLEVAKVLHQFFGALAHF